MNYSIIKKSIDWKPKFKFLVYVEIAWYPHCGFKPDEKMISRIGMALDREGVRKLIADDKKAMGDTFGGLIDAVGTKGRSYFAFEVTGEFKPVTI